jgi:hypothetical protein
MVVAAVLTLALTLPSQTADKPAGGGGTVEVRRAALGRAAP